MKDWLSALLKTRDCLKSQEVDGTVDFDGVATAFSPFLKTLSTVTGASVESLVADAMFQYLSTKADIVAHNEKLQLLRAETDEWKTPKSGKLDKVSDDCLRLALSYLDTDCRCLKVERSCKRLFHLSREVPLRCYFFEEIFRNKAKMTPTAAIRVAHRHRIAYLTIDDNLDEWLFDDVSEETAFDLMRKSIGVFQNTVSRVYLNSGELFDFSETHFKCLKTLDFNSDLDSPRIEKFLEMHSDTLSHVTFDVTQSTNDSILRKLADCKRLLELTLSINSPFDGVPTDCNFDQIERLSVENNCEWSLRVTPAVLGPLFHRGLRHLKLGGNWDCGGPKMPRLPHLETLELSHRHAAVLRNMEHVLAAVNPSVLQRCNLHNIALEKMPKLLAAMKGFPDSELRVRFWIKDTDVDFEKLKADLIDALVAAKSTGDCVKRLYVQLDGFTFTPALSYCTLQLLSCLGLVCTCLPPTAMPISATVWEKVKVHIPAFLMKRLESAIDICIKK